ncbi:MAG: peptidylprolyl isomerase [Anaerolineae bacterium]|nr:peptidylprolyl isomerase [Anaerolineae bacterium]
MAKTLTEVQDGVVVGLDYTLRMDDGEVLDTSEGHEPLEFIQGAGGLVKGFADAVYGLKIGEEKDFVVPPDLGYGTYDPKANMVVPATAFPQGMTPEVGLQIHVRSANGGTQAATVMEISDRGVLLDLNHALAGKTLHFHVKILALREPTDEERQHGHVHSGGHHH